MWLSDEDFACNLMEEALVHFEMGAKRGKVSDNNWYLYSYYGTKWASDSSRQRGYHNDRGLNAFPAITDLEG